MAGFISLLCFFEKIQFAFVSWGHSWPLHYWGLVPHRLAVPDKLRIFDVSWFRGVQQPCSQPCWPFKPTYETRRPPSSNQGFFTQETRSGSERVTLNLRPPTATVRSAAERAASKISFHDATIIIAIFVGKNLLLNKILQQIP